jgi:hypothetical protein
LHGNFGLNYRPRCGAFGRGRVRSGNPADIPPGSSLIVRRLAGRRHLLCGAPRYLETHPTTTCLADLIAHNCLRYAYY